MLEVYKFPADQVEPQIAEVGGKAYSLIKSAAAGLPVPSGFVLSVTFFNAWITELQRTAAWTAFLTATPDMLHQACDELKSAALQLQYTQEQQSVLSGAFAAWDDEAALFAVRSSSPEEDLEGTSFAGGYETILGVKRATAHDAIKKAFVSCLDYRIVAYKSEHGFDIKTPRIAIVIQQQIASETAGVGFSLNPVNNDYDEAVINANWGLGETVVAGIATPDTFVMDKLSRTIKERRLGGKEKSIWLAPDGGTAEKEGIRSSEFSLADEQLFQLVTLINTVEALYKKPVDIEWAFAGGKLYLLQARPITAYFSLPAELVTSPGSHKRLYLDFTISLQGIYTPLSVLATSMFKEIMSVVGGQLGVKGLGKNLDDTLPYVTTGRMFLNLSNALTVADRIKIANALENVDPLAARTVASIDEKVYKNPSGPSVANTIFHAAPHLLRPGLRVIEAFLRPRFVHERSQNKRKEFLNQAERLASQQKPLQQLWVQLLQLTWSLVENYSIPLVLASRVALNKMKSMVTVDSQSDADIAQLELALPHNVTTEMGLVIYEISKHVPDDMDATALAEALKNANGGALSQAWESFLARYGHRGPEEIDIAAPRYRDNPALLVDLIMSMKNSSSTSNHEDPETKFQRNQLQRKNAFSRLRDRMNKTKPAQAKEFQHLYEVLETLGGYRETHKYCVVFAIDLLRQRVIEVGVRLHAQGRLESAQQIFDLTLDEIDRACTDLNMQCVRVAAQNRAPIDALRKTRRLPTVFDSRGRILRPPPPPAKEGTVVGIPISAGVVRGRIKNLHFANEKALEKGEILVARATDPGWTPLFVNAGGVILGVGGVLQHGALVAREYGLPCVAGVEDATSRWQDGALVEVDGSSGEIRLLEDK